MLCTVQIWGYKGVTQVFASIRIAFPPGASSVHSGVRREFFAKRMPPYGRSCRFAASTSEAAEMTPASPQLRGHRIHAPPPTPASELALGETHLGKCFSPHLSPAEARTPKARWQYAGPKLTPGRSPCTRRGSQRRTKCELLRSSQTSVRRWHYDCRLQGDFPAPSQAAHHPVKNVPVAQQPRPLEAGPLHLTQVLILSLTSSPPRLSSGATSCPAN